MNKSTINNEKGFVLITSLLMLVVLMIIGIAATNTTTLELQISGNDKAAKQTFYQAEAGTQIGIELLEEAIYEAGYSDDADIGAVHITNGDFYLNQTLPAWTIPDAEFNQTDIIFSGSSNVASGNAIQMVAGYEGKGKAGGSGGVDLTYDIQSRHSGPNNSEETVIIEWNHRL